MTYAARTDPGRIRSCNEDTYGVRVEDGFWMVADGLGGHEGGRLASEIAKSEVCRFIEKGVQLKDCVLLAHSAIVSAAQKGEGPSGMGSTIVALKSSNGKYDIAWVGDSRAYLWNGRLTQLTRDHSLVQELLDNGRISKDSAEIANIQNVITQCLGPPNDGEPRVDVYNGEWRNGEKVLLCSDGLYGELSDEKIATIISQTKAKTEEDTVNALVEAALKAGGNDNVTAVFVSGPNQKYGWRSKRVMRVIAAAIGIVVLMLYLFWMQ